MEGLVDDGAGDGGDDVNDDEEFEGDIASNCTISPSFNLELQAFASAMERVSTNHFATPQSTTPARKTRIVSAGVWTGRYLEIPIIWPACQAIVLAWTGSVENIIRSLVILGSSITGELVLPIWDVFAGGLRARDRMMDIVGTPKCKWE